MTRNRNKRIKHLTHSASRAIVDYLEENNVDTLHVGWNTSIKSGPSKMGKKFTQRFRSIPWREFVDLLTYKCEARGIRVVETEESYTSKTSLLDDEQPVKHAKGTYSGTRCRRGLFRSRLHWYINADLNGAGQILRKNVPSGFRSWCAGHAKFDKAIFSPTRIKPGGGRNAPLIIQYGGPIL